MAASGIRIRRATCEDYEEVIAINDDIYYGLDYMQTMFFQYIQSNRHVVYVAETADKKLVSLMNFRLETHDDETLVSMSWRTRDGYTKRGLGNALYTQLHKDYPQAKHFVGDTFLKPATMKFVNDGKILYQWNTFLSHVNPASLRAVAAVTSTRTPACTRPVCLSHSEVMAFVTSGCCERFLKKYTIDYVVGGDNVRRPVRLCENELKELFAATRTLVTYDEQKSRQDGGIVPTGTGVAGAETHQWSREIRCMSFCNSYLLKTRSFSGDVRADIFFYGNHLDDLMEHCYEHLRHLATICGASDLHVVFNFPLQIDATVAEETISNSFGFKVEDLYSSRISCLFIRTIDWSQLG